MSWQEPRAWDRPAVLRTVCHRAPQGGPSRSPDGPAAGSHSAPLACYVTSWLRSHCGHEAAGRWKYEGNGKENHCADARDSSSSKTSVPAGCKEVSHWRVQREGSKRQEEEMPFRTKESDLEIFKVFIDSQRSRTLLLSGVSNPGLIGLLVFLFLVWWGEEWFQTVQQTGDYKDRNSYRDCFSKKVAHLLL